MNILFGPNTKTSNDLTDDEEIQILEAEIEAERYLNGVDVNDEYSILFNAN